MKITTTKCVLQNENTCVIQWETEDGGYGELAIERIPDTGDYKISAEYMSLDFIMKVIKMTDFSIIERLWR